MEIINWQEDDIKQIVLTEPLMRLRLIRAKETYLLGSRGSFKTSNGISFYVADCTYEMPGASGIICGPSFEHLLDNTLNPLFNSLSKYGLVEGVHFVIGAPPPRSWPKPHIRVPSKKYDHIVSWHNGSNQYLISMAKKGSANGISCQYGVFDEAKFLNPEELKEIVFPAFRGNEHLYKNHPLYLSKFFATDKLAELSKVDWLLKKRGVNNPEKNDVIITLQLELNRLRLQYNDAGVNKKAALKPQIHAIETRLALLRQNLQLYIETNAKDSIQLLGENWYKDKVDNSTPYVKRIAYDNEDPDRPEEGFYPDFTREKHVHARHDYDAALPIILVADYQHSVAPIMLAQINKLVLGGKHSLNIIDEVYTLAPLGLDEAVEEFCNKYRHHLKKVVYYVYDQTATGKRMNAKKYKETVIDVLRKHRWAVVEVYIGQQPQHYDKYKDTKAWLKEEDATAILIRINAKCVKSIKSIEGAAAYVDTKGETKKNKTYENTTKYPHLDQSETTHFSDCFDMLTDAVLKKKKIPLNFGVGRDDFGVR